MQSGSESTNRRPIPIPWMLGSGLFLAIAGFFLWQEHRAHLLGALPWVLLLLCPVVHLIMHRGHGDHGREGSADPGQGHRHQGEGGLR